METISIDWLGDVGNDGVETRRLRVQEMGLKEEEIKTRKKMIDLAAATKLEEILNDLSRFDRAVKIFAHEKGNLKENLEKLELHDILEKAGQVDKKINVLIHIHTCECTQIQTFTYYRVRAGFDQGQRRSERARGEKEH